MALLFQQKNIGVFEILMFEILTKQYLTTLLVLNNRAQAFNIIVLVLSVSDEKSSTSGTASETDDEMSKVEKHDKKNKPNQKGKSISKFPKRKGRKSLKS